MKFIKQIGGTVLFVASVWAQALVGKFEPKETDAPDEIRPQLPLSIPLHRHPMLYR